MVSCCCRHSLYRFPSYTDIGEDFPGFSLCVERICCKFTALLKRCRHSLFLCLFVFIVYSSVFLPLMDSSLFAIANRQHCVFSEMGRCFLENGGDGLVFSKGNRGGHYWCPTVHKHGGVYSHHNISNQTHCKTTIHFAACYSSWWDAFLQQKAVYKPQWRPCAAISHLSTLLDCKSHWSLDCSCALPVFESACKAPPEYIFTLQYFHSSPSEQLD